MSIFTNKKGIILPKIETVYCLGKVIYSSGPRYVSEPAINFAFTGKIQEYVIQKTGLYLLTCRGAQGTNGCSGRGGEGGISNKYVYIIKGDILYIVCGGTSGYNGGGGGTYRGGGATHIALRSGLLSQLASYRSDILVVAGGGGAGGCTHLSTTLVGGVGGGLYGGNGYTNATNVGMSFGTGGTQSSPGYMNGNSTIFVGGFGRGGSVDSTSTSAGGGGLYGGGGGGNYNGGSAGGGGSGYIGESTTIYKEVTFKNTTTAGLNSGNGSASIQLIAV